MKQNQAFVITIANSKGGVGKTTTAVNTAAGLALRLAHTKEGRTNRVLLVDIDPIANAVMALNFDEHIAPPENSIYALFHDTPPPSPPTLVRKARHHENLFFIPGNRDAMEELSLIELANLMNREARLAQALNGFVNQFDYVIIDTGPSVDLLLVNALVLSTHVVFPVETSYLGGFGLREIEKNVSKVETTFGRKINILGIVPTLYDERLGDSTITLEEIEKHYPKELVLPVIHSSSDIKEAHARNMDVFVFKPPRSRSRGQLASSSRPTKEYAALVNAIVHRLTGR